MPSLLTNPKTKSGKMCLMRSFSRYNSNLTNTFVRLRVAIALLGTTNLYSTHFFNAA